MIHLRFSISNPFNAPSDHFQHFFEWVPLVTKNKAIEIECHTDDGILLAAAIDIMFGGRDHVGPQMSLTLFGYTLSIAMTDRRHWDHENNCWKESP